MELKKVKTLLMIVFVVLILLGGFLLRLNHAPAYESHTERLVLLAPPKSVIAPPLWLTNEGILSDGLFKDHWTFIYFGFTHCPDVCPTTLAALSRAYLRLAKEGVADNIQIYFVTVDPKNDDVGVLKEYLKSFNPKFIGASGTPARLEFFKKQFGIYSDNTDPNKISHSESIVVVNPQGLWVGLLMAPHFVDDLVKDLSYLLH